MPSELQQIEAAIAGLESQRALLGDAIADTALAPLRAKLSTLALARPTPDRGQTLKQVTILFLDIVGSTTLSQHLDPEDIHAVMDSALARCTAIVEARQGKVLQYAGDNLLAVFGADAAQEDDAERALHAGLALLEEGRAQGLLVQQRHGHSGFDVRIGVHTGGVLLGGGVDAEGSIRGMSVNIAARMEQAAPTGGMRISMVTYRQVRGVFDVEPQPPIEVKGLDEPIASCLVLRAKPRAFRVVTRGIEGVETRMVGRDAELEQVQLAFKRLYRDGMLLAVTIVAEAGIGKSRLLYEFQNWAEAQAESFCLFQGRAHPQTQSQPYGLLRDILAWRLQIADSDSMEVAKLKFEQGIVPLFIADDGEDVAQSHAHLLGHLIGLDFGDSKYIQGIRDDGKQIRRRAFHAAAQLFRRVAVRDGAPIVLLLDDLHWADDGSFDFLNHLVRVNRDVPMLVLGLTRPFLFERRADWPDAPGAQRIELGPLDKGSSRRLADELLQRLPAIPAALRELITGGAEGNPFYMEELVKMLVDEGAISVHEGRWTVHPDRLLATHVPQTLTGVLQARLDSVKPAEKLALQQAAVIGFVFWDQALAAIDAYATESLPGVSQRALVTPHQEAGFDGVREYAFSHQILHHVTYDTVLKRLRRGYHATAGAWLAGLTGARANDFLGLAAEHFEKAGDNDQACELFARAAEYASARYAHEAVMAHVAQALAMMSADSNPTGAELAASSDKLRLRWRLLEVRERTLGLQGRRIEQLADIAALQGLADALADDRLRFEAAWRRCDIALRMADYRTMEGIARQALALAERVDDAALRLRAQQRLAIALGELGDLAAGKALAQEGLAGARALGLRRLESLFMNVLSVAASMQDDQMLALEIDQQKLLIDRELGNPLNEAITIGNLGESWLQLGDYAQARRDLEEGLRLSRAVGDHAMQCVPLLNLSQLMMRNGDAAAALEHAQAALEIAVTVQNPETEARAQWASGQAELALGRHTAAAAAFERAHGVARAADVATQHDAAAGIARVALAQGDVAAAMRAAEAVLAHLATGATLEGTDGPRLIKLTCHRVLAHAGDPRAAAVLATAHTELQALAAAITDATLRHSFLANIPEHREIVAAWEAAEAGASRRV